MTVRYGMTLALRDDPALVERYKEYHRHVWPEVVERLREIGILELQIFLLGRRLFLWMEAVDGFEPERDLARLGEDERYREWDELMRTMQEPVPEARPTDWWAPMELVFDLGWPQKAPAAGSGHE
jgi:L-rhamnose mutarotase